MIYNIQQIKNVLFFEVEMPVDKDGKQLTKNRKVIMLRGNHGMPRAITPTPIRRWKLYIEALSLAYRDVVQSFLTSINYVDKTSLDVRIYWKLKTLRTDPHNYNELLLDGIQSLTGINDRYFCVHVDGVVKEASCNTTGYVALHKHNTISYDKWKSGLLEIDNPVPIL